jgi:hypothetical protein
MSTVETKKPVSKMRYYSSLLESLLLFFISVIFIHYSSLFAEIKASSPVDDIILSNTKVYEVEFFFVHVAIGLILFVIALCLKFRTAAPFLIKTVSLFMVVRSVFVSLTHIGPFPTRLAIESNLLNFITTGNDLFFSGHTGLPFLVALIFWNHIYLRGLFLVASVMFAITVLLAHLHYSIDVFAAFFITYSIYHIALILFKKDYEFSRLDSK